MERNIREYQTVILAAFLHDMGKLLGRGRFRLVDKGQHPKFSATFVGAFSEIFEHVSDVSLLRDLVQRHHESKQYFAPEFLVQGIKDEHVRTLATLVSKADNLSSSERGTRSEQWQDYRETPLASVLERVNQVSDESQRLRHHPGALCPPDSLQTVLPDEFTAYAEGELTRHITKFGDDFRRLFQDGGATGVATTDFECLLSHVLSILYRYTWCIPSNTQEAIPDVSLYDHLKTTAAIASCLYLYHAGTGTLGEQELGRTDINRFCLVVGDLSGIQSYIFNIATIGAGGGVARRLRSRSLYVQLCTEVAAQFILRSLQVPTPIHTLMNSGGRFYLLLPNLPQTHETLSEIQLTVDKWFIEKLNGELALNLAYVEFGDDGFKAGQNEEGGFSRVLEQVNLALTSRKQNRFGEALRTKGTWTENSFTINTSYEGRATCISCTKFPEAEDGLCSQCQLDRDIGSILPRARYLAFFDSKAGAIPLLGHSVSLLESIPAWPAPISCTSSYVVVIVKIASGAGGRLFLALCGRT